MIDKTERRRLLSIAATVVVGHTDVRSKSLDATLRGIDGATNMIKK
jgi:hypothetical protein